MQLGFVIDHSRCIGCHACTVACKAENDVPLGKFRTWVKYVEQGSFPQVQRSFAVLRCNQCSDAPCVTICPVRALSKRPDGIVDVDPAVCIGCKACMQGCPYDALYLHEGTGTAQKCHFCAHRVEVGLAPACAVICPTEAIVPGDFDDPASAVSTLRASHSLSSRRPEAGTRPNVLYREVGPAGIDPSLTHAAGGYLWASTMPGLDIEAEQFAALQQAAERRAGARTTYDVEHPPPWGGKVSAYLFTKSLAAGAFLLMAIAWLSTRGDLASLGPAVRLGLPSVAIGFLALTTVLLVADLERPERFLLILTRPNWSSWLARGSLILMGYGALLALWCGLVLLGGAPRSVEAGLVGLGSLLAALTACYTGWLFGQARGRVLWMRRGLWLHLIVQAIVAGAALVVLATPWSGAPRGVASLGRGLLQVALAVHLLVVLLESRMAPARRGGEYARASALIERGPFARRRYLLGIALGIVVPSLLLTVPHPAAWSVAGAVALIGLWVEEDILVRAGQAPAIS